MIISLEKQLLVFLRVAFYTGYTVHYSLVPIFHHRIRAEEKRREKLSHDIWTSMHENLTVACEERKSSLIRAFVIHSLDGIIAKLAACKVSVVQLVSVAEQTGLSVTWETLKDRLSRVEAHIISIRTFPIWLSDFLILFYRLINMNQQEL